MDPLLQGAIDACSREPIHIPGRIQPHGFLLAFAAMDRRITHCSDNVASYIDRAAADLIGSDFLALFDDPAGLDAQIAQVEEQPLHLGAVQLAAKSFDLVAHRRGRVVIAEFEPAFTGGVASMFPVVDTFVTRLQQARSIETLCRLAVNEVQRLTRFGRVLAYTFDAEGHGNVVAEVVAPSYASYEGLRFPASDIPEQARALYQLNRIRVISDADYAPVALLAAADQSEPLDLSFAHLRSVSPVHVQYMKNMGTLASMSISILVEGRLWGLISCHDAQPTPVPLHTRAACELLGKILSLQVEAREAHMQAQRLLELRRMLVRLLATIADSDHFVRGFLDGGQQLLDFGRAHGVAIITGDTCATLGTVPDEAALYALAQWLDERGERNVFATDALGALNADFAPLAPIASGLLALSISELYPNYILWFRPELVRTVHWAGRPDKPVAAQERLSPRQSFAAWSEILRGQSQPWESAEIEAAIELRSAVLGIVLRQAEEMAQLADELQRSNSELESFSYSVSHDLRAPLRHIAGYAELLVEDAAGELSDRAHRYLRNIGESARFAGTLVDDLLSFSQMGRAALRPTTVDLAQLIEHIRKEFAPDLQGRDIEWVLQPLPIVQGDTAFLHLALRNLLANAVKYTSTRAHARIEIGALRDAKEENVIYIRDNGVGFDMQYVDKLFGVFQRLHRMDEFEGTGIGLANVRRIMERHGGRVWGDSIKDQGATFYFALPHTIPEDIITQRRGQIAPNA